MNKDFGSPKQAAIASGLLVVTLIVSFALPRPRYESPVILSQLEVPFEMAHWQSRDMSHQLDVRDQRYNFVSQVFTRQYGNDLGERLLFLVLDAGNFHHPGVCYKSSGYQAIPMDDVSMEAGGRHFKAHALFMDKGRDSTVVIYWMCIDKKITDWTSQKFTEFFRSLFH